MCMHGTEQKLVEDPQPQVQNRTCFTGYQFQNIPLHNLGSYLHQSAQCFCFAVKIVPRICGSHHQPSGPATRGRANPAQQSTVQWHMYMYSTDMSVHSTTCSSLPAGQCVLDTILHIRYVHMLCIPLTDTCTPSANRVLKRLSAKILGKKYTHAIFFFYSIKNRHLFWGKNRNEYDKIGMVGRYVPIYTSIPFSHAYKILFRWKMNK